MRKKPLPSVTAAELRRRAQAQLRERQKKQLSAIAGRKSAVDTHQLQSHEIELEMQKAELQESRDRMEVLLEKYTDLYDFAPIGYFSLDERGRILEVNLAGAALLGVERAWLVNRSLTHYVTPTSRSSFRSFLEQIFSEPRRRLCEATLLKADGTLLWAGFHGTSAISGRGARKWCRVAVSDITARKQAEQALQSAQHELEQRVEERTSELQRNCARLAHEIEERKRAEEGLKESEEMLRSIFASTPDSITVVDLDGRIKHCNQSTAHIHGFSSAEQLLGKNVAELVAEEDRQRMPEVTQHVLTHGVAKDVPFVGLKGSGGNFAGELSFSVLKDGSGGPIGFVGITRDVTERKRTEDALRASELKYRNLVEMTGTGYLIIDVQGRVLDANQEYVRISGHGELREIIGRSVIEWTAEKAKQRNAEAVAQCAKDGFIRNFVTEYTAANGKTTFVEVNATVEGEGESARIVSLCRDITERKRAEEALYEGEERLHQAAEAAGFGAYRYDLVSGKAYYSPEFLALYGLPPDATIEPGPHMLSNAVHPDDKGIFLAAARRSADPNGPGIFEVEFRVPDKDDRLRWLRACGRTVFDEDGQTRRPVRAIGIIQDITKRKRAEAELLRERADLAHVARVSTMGELAASVAHELNQPLGAILANAEAAELFLQQDPPALEDLRAILVDIRKDDERAGEVIRRMGTLLRKRELEGQPLEINSLSEDVLQLISGDALLRGVSLTVDLSPLLPKVSGDRVHLQQVLLNLILNGMDAMAGQPRERRQIMVRTRLSADGRVELAVIDSGHGIEPNQLPHLFEPFYTTKPNGMGMGLSIARTIIEAHHGRIWAENNPTGGAVFRIVLPPLKE